MLVRGARAADCILQTPTDLPGFAQAGATPHTMPTSVLQTGLRLARYGGDALALGTPLLSV